MVRKNAESKLHFFFGCFSFAVNSKAMFKKKRGRPRIKLTGRLEEKARDKSFFGVAVFSFLVELEGVKGVTANVEEPKF
jgi:hypothetical protein